MSDEVPYERDRFAKWYAKQGFRIDPGLVAVYDLPSGAPEREIRQVEVNSLAHEFPDADLEPHDCAVAINGPNQHKLLVLTVTPAQWGRVEAGACPLPAGWSLDGARLFRPKATKR